ncbi:MAG TPA: cytochrome c oxidase assembly protein [Rhizomicrobium sp.]|jgi:cytochrome c oxidase assembly factor CtaG
MIELDWEFDPFVVAPLAVSAVLYSAGVARLWRRAGIGRGVRRWQAASFATGWMMLVVALVSPLHEFGEHLFAAHMIEHEILMAVAAPLLALSRPIGAFLFALPKSWREWLSRRGHDGWIAWPWRWLTRPLNATILHGIAIWVWHMPALFDATVTNENMHRLQHLSFLVTALFFWWALLGHPRRNYGSASLHVAATMVHTGILGALIALAPRLLYVTQTMDAPAFGLTPMEDQQLAGLIMWVPAGTIYAAVALALLAFWITAKGRRAMPSYAK